MHMFKVVLSLPDFNQLKSTSMIDNCTEIKPVRANPKETMQVHQGLWIGLDKWEVDSQAALENFESHDDFGFYKFYMGLINELLRQAGSDERQGVHIVLPDPYASATKFKVWSVADYVKNGVKAYEGYALADVFAKIRLTLSANHLRALIISTKGSWQIVSIDKSDHLYLMHKCQ